MSEDAIEILQCIIHCEISLYTALYAPNRAVVPISNILSLKKGWTKYRAKKAIKELRNLDLIEYTSQGCPAIESFGEYRELVEEASPPINGYALTEKAFKSELWIKSYDKWCKSMEEWANG